MHRAEQCANTLDRREPHVEVAVQTLGNFLVKLEGWIYEALSDRLVIPGIHPQAKVEGGVIRLQCRAFIEHRSLLIRPWCSRGQSAHTHRWARRLRWKDLPRAVIVVEEKKREGAGRALGLDAYAALMARSGSG